MRCSRVRAETAEHFDAHRIIEHALPESLEMLLRENGGRHEHRDLLAFHDRFECGANRHLGFAEADVAADQAIHRARLFHVALGRGDRLELVGRFAKRKRMFELDLPLRVGAEGVAELRFALGLHGQHFSGVVEDGGGRVFLCPRPFGIRERAERRRFLSRRRRSAKRDRPARAGHRASIRWRTPAPALPAISAALRVGTRVIAGNRPTPCSR